MSCCSFQSDILKWAKLGLAYFVLVTSPNLIPQQAVAASGNDPTAQLLPALPIEWLFAPKRVPLETLADFNIPEGYKFAPAKAARAFLESESAQVPRNLLGVLAQANGRSYVVLSFADSGYLTPPEKEQLGSAEILKALQTALGPKNAAPTWEIAPSFDPSTHVLEWALRSGDQVYHSVRWLTRRGVLEATGVHAAGANSAFTALKLALNSDSFKNGERYEDHLLSDKAASLSLSQLVIGNSAGQLAKTSPANAEASSNRAMMVVVVAFVVLASLGGFVLFRKIGRRKDSSTQPAVASVAERPVTRRTIIAAGADTAQTSTPPKPNGETTLSGLRRNGGKSLVNNNNNQQNGSRRKRVFDYNRYFSDLMNAVSSSNHMDPLAANGHSVDPDRMAVSASAGESDASQSARFVTTNSEVINYQKSLIEEQKRLIEEQSRLIEEKSKLIAEKNQLLKMQSEWIDSKLL